MTNTLNLDRETIKLLILNTNKAYGLFDTSEVFDFLEIICIENFNDNQDLLDLIHTQRNK